MRFERKFSKNNYLICFDLTNESKKKIIEFLIVLLNQEILKFLFEKLKYNYKIINKQIFLNISKNKIKLIGNFNNNRYFVYFIF